MSSNEVEAEKKPVKNLLSIDEELQLIKGEDGETTATSGNIKKKSKSPKIPKASKESTSI